MIETVHTNDAPAAIGPYSQAIKTGGLLFASGQIPVNPADNSIQTDIESQTRQAFTNLKSVLETRGSSLKNVVKTTVFIQDINDFAAVNEIYSKFFSEPFPARSCVEVSKLPKGVKLEIEAIATA